MKYRLINIVASSLMTGALLSTSVLAKDDFPEVTEEGLHRVGDAELSLVYADEGVDLGAYSRVLLLDATIAFEKNWQRDQNRSYAFKVDARDMERIKSGLAELFREVFTETLTEAGHELVTEPADDVLIVRPAIINLDVNAPDTHSTGRGYQMVDSAGEMTLYVELYDSVTSALLVKALDRRSDRRSSTFQWQTQGSNRLAAKRMLSHWAEILSDALAEAKSAVSGSEED